jgi:hypothetical protein
MSAARYAAQFDQGGRNGLVDMILNIASKLLFASPSKAL